VSAGRSPRAKLALSVLLVARPQPPGPAAVEVGGPAAATADAPCPAGVAVAAHRTPGLVRRSLWFDKTSIRSGGEPERLPYTVYDLPLAPPPPGGQPGRVR
jgi:hypothetical protein